jgi:hypothetical protein
MYSGTHYEGNFKISPSGLELGNLKQQQVQITSKSSKFKGATQHYLVKLPKSAGARHDCPKIAQVPGTLGIRANSSPALEYL